MQFVLDKVCYGLALDLNNRRLYLTELADHAISSIKTDGRYYTKLVNDNVKSPVSIVLDTARG